MAIKGVEQSRLVHRGLRVDAAQRVGFHKEGNFERFVICPEAHATLPGIVAPALIGETKWHSNHHRLFPARSPISFGPRAPAGSSLYEPRDRVDLDRGSRISRGPPFRQALLPLQRTQMRSPAHALSKIVRHLRHGRGLRLSSP